MYRIEFLNYDLPTILHFSPNFIKNSPMNSMGPQRGLSWNQKSKTSNLNPYSSTVVDATLNKDTKHSKNPQRVLTVHHLFLIVHGPFPKSVFKLAKSHYIFICFPVTSGFRCTKHTFIKQGNKRKFGNANVQSRWKSFANVSLAQKP